MKQYVASPYLINVISLVSESMEMVYLYNISITFDNHHADTPPVHDWYMSSTCYSSELATVNAALEYITEHINNANANVQKLRQSINSKGM